MATIFCHSPLSQKPEGVRTDNQSDRKLQEIWASPSPTLLTVKVSEHCPAGIRKYQWTHFIELYVGRLQKAGWRNNRMKMSRRKRREKKLNWEEGSPNKDWKACNAPLCTHKPLIPVLLTLLSCGQTALCRARYESAPITATLLCSLPKQGLENLRSCLAELKEQLLCTK